MLSGKQANKGMEMNQNGSNLSRCVKLNTDVASRGSPGLVGAGGILRNGNGK